MSTIPRQDIAQVIAQRIEKTSTSTDIAREVAAYLISVGQEKNLESIMRDVMNIRSQNGLLEADVRAAHSVDAATMTELKELIVREFSANGHVIVDQTVSPEVIGGVRIVTASEQLDLSVRGKLDTFKRLTNGGTVL
jgi:F0F1-type ATP synthase delta subunit